MNTYSKTILLTISLLLSLNVQASVNKMSHAEVFKACKHELKAQYDNIESIKLSKLSEFKKVVTAKMRVRFSDDRSLVECSMSPQGVIALNIK